MAACDIQSLLDDATCFAALPPGLLRAATAQLWCQVADGIANLDNPNPSIQSLDDGLWYRTGGIELAPNDAIFWMTQVVTAAGPNPYLVIVEPISGDKYKIEAVGTSPNVQWQVDGPVLDPETPTQIVVLGTTYDLAIDVSGAIPVPVLTPA